MKTIYRVFRITNSQSMDTKGTYTFFPIYDSQRNKIGEFDDLEEAKEFISQLVQRDFGPYTIVTTYTR